MRGKKEIEEFEEERRRRRRSLAWGFIFALVTIILAGFFWTSCAHGQANDQPAVSIEGELGFWSQYLGNNGGIFHDAPVLQGNITAEFRGGLYVDLWASRAEGPWLSTYGDEGNLVVGYSPNDRLDLGVAYVLLSELSPTDAGWAYVQLTSRPIEQRGWSLSVFTKIDYYWPLETANDVEGYNFHLGATLTQGWGKWSSSQGAEVLYDTGAWGAGEGLVWIASVEVAREVGKTSVGLGAKYARGITVPEWDDRTGEFVFGTFIRF